MNIKQLLCFHNYSVKADKVNFYGSVTISECCKCDKRKVKTIGYPEWGLPSKTKITHYE